MVLAVLVLASIGFGYDTITYCSGSTHPDWNPSGDDIDIGTRYDRADFDPITTIYGIQLNVRYYDEGDTVYIALFKDVNGQPDGYNHGGSITPIRGWSGIPTINEMNIYFGNPWSIPDDVESFWIIIMNSSENFPQHVYPRLCNGLYTYEDQSFYNDGTGWNPQHLIPGGQQYRNFRIKVYVDEFQSLTLTSWGSIKASF